MVGSLCGLVENLSNLGGIPINILLRNKVIQRTVPSSRLLELNKGLANFANQNF